MARLIEITITTEIAKSMAIYNCSYVQTSNSSVLATIHILVRCPILQEAGFAIDICTVLEKAYFPPQLNKAPGYTYTKAK